MLGPADIQKLATIIDPERDFMEVGPVEEVDVDHLDYDYVKGCENVKELVELLNYLKLVNYLNNQGRESRVLSRFGSENARETCRVRSGQSSTAIV
jgi:hypothetical protein